MQKINTKSGYIAYQVKRVEIEDIGINTKCDTCGAAPPAGYIVPVLNVFLCPTCYKK